MNVSRETPTKRTPANLSDVYNAISDKTLSSGSFEEINQPSLVVIISYIQSRALEPTVVLCDDSASALSLYSSVYYTFPETTFYFPVSQKSDVGGFVGENDRYREELLQRLSVGGRENIVIITTSESLNENNISLPAREKILKLFLGHEMDVGDLSELLSSWKYEKVVVVENPGEYSTRGDIVDFFPLFLTNPIRIEFEFSAIVSIRTFDQSSQLTLHMLESFSLTPVITNVAQAHNYQSLGSVLPHFVEYKYHSQAHHFYRAGDDDLSGCFNVGVGDINIKTLPFLAKKEALALIVGRFVGQQIFYFGNNVGLISKYIDSSQLTHINADLICGFYSESLGLCCLSENDFIGGGAKSRWEPTQKAVSNVGLNSLAEIAVGDYLVYRPFGVCKYRGLSVVGSAGGEQECLELEFAHDSKVFVALDKMDLVHRYLSSSDAPVLSVLGGKRWANDIKKAKKSVELVVGELIKLYSQKNQKRDFLYDQPGELYHALVDTFPFNETDDQASAIGDVLNDMSLPVPMDRFICGDVGFGKTEVALRAIMLAVTSGKQAFFLCPTTILADQHYITCRERLEHLGVVVELLSRFKTPAEQKNIISLASRGRVDVLVGTHRLLSEDVFVPNLSLLVVDEEHRFGVKHKEKIRLLKTGLDILSLSATPIPRTLQQSLSGIKNISKILTPPVSRRPISTHIKYFSFDAVYSQIDLELARGGQIFFLHNDIDSIPSFYDKIIKKYPSKSVAFIHGRLESRLLEKTILSFFRGDVDILICTTIIESGLDVTNANTIIINNAQNFGLSQLYQIRGRVGRGHHRASCLLLVPHAHLEKNAYRRLKTIEQHTSLGSGYEISLKDLEIRGAGALFGYKQSGHISSVGFQMYCDLLKDAMRGANDNFVEELVFPTVLFDGSALLPDNYIEEASARLFYYDQLSKATTRKEIEKVERDVQDRFGVLPLDAVQLILIAKIKINLANSIVSSVLIKEKRVEFVFSALGHFEDVNSLLSLFYTVLGNYAGEIKLSEKKNGFIGLRLPAASLGGGLDIVKNSVPLLLRSSGD
ncbi:MAG: DEAD/DEAH box helicase [Candidatus Marinimicrobia bacterium]|nr:DEAD/DEAH box helicase [Candidatus Neomarinimicrobiota bacterium]